MTLAEYLLLYGEPGLEALAASTARPDPDPVRNIEPTKVSYLLQLIYRPGEKEPSLSLACRLREGSGNRLSLEAMCRGAQVDHRVIRSKTRKPRKPRAVIGDA